MSDKMTVYICTVCRLKDEPDSRPGQQLVERLEARLTPQDRELIAVETVECLGVCTRPCTLAMAAPGKWTVVLGDFDAERDVDDLVRSLQLYAASENGRVPKKDRPEAFRKGGVSRTPPPPK